MKSIFLCAVLCLGAAAGFAQQSFTDSLRTATSRNEQKRWNLFRNELGFTVDNLLLAGQAPTVVFKRRYETGKLIRVRRTQALRAMLTLQLDETLKAHYPEDPGFYYSDPSSTFAAVAFGRETQENLGRFQFFYGLDVTGQFQSNRFLYYTFYSVGPDTYKSYSTRYIIRTIGGGVAGFAGLRFFLHPRISMALESGLALGYLRTTEFQREAGPDFAPPALLNKSDRLYANVLGKRFFTLNFHF